jgi:tRNA A-37 threonylcarbamoyl transferase component Bud32
MAATSTTAADALHDEEVDRTREFLRMGWWLALGAAVAVLIIPGDRRIAIALCTALTVTVLASMWIHRRLRDPGMYDPRTITPLALAAVVCGQLGTAYCGIFSAAPVVVVLGLNFFCRTEHTAGAVMIYLAAASAQAATAALVISGAVDDPGFYPTGGRASSQAQIVGQITVQFGYAMAFVLARLTRRASLHSIEQLQAATRLAAQREAQVDELRQDLDRALKIGGPGRFTGHRAGAWELGNVLGRGAMGEVYEATNARGDDAAVKLLRRELLGDRKHVERFLREVRAASSLESPHVVKVIEASTPEDPLPFLAMERLRGATLGEQLRDGGALPRPKLITLVEQIGAVLDRARAVGLVHRDLKPHNLFLTEDGIWKILDFGVALLGETSGTLTQGGVVGTPAYMAPEQAKGEAVDHRADLYALGALVYRCLTGRVPFVARDTPALLYSVVHQMPLRPSAIAAAGTATFDHDAFLAVALAKGKDARFQTGGELVAAFRDTENGALADGIRRRARIVLRSMTWRELEAGTQQIK